MCVCVWVLIHLSLWGPHYLWMWICCLFKILMLNFSSIFALFALFYTNTLTCTGFPVCVLIHLPLWGPLWRATYCRRVILKLRNWRKFFTSVFVNKTKCIIYKYILQINWCVWSANKVVCVFFVRTSIKGVSDLIDNIFCVFLCVRTFFPVHHNFRRLQMWFRT